MNRCLFTFVASAALALPGSTKVSAQSSSPSGSGATTPQSGGRQVGKRLGKGDTAARINPAARLPIRLDSRIDSRINSRLEQAYQLPSDGARKVREASERVKRRR